MGPYLWVSRTHRKLFQRFMDMVLWGLTWTSVLVYINDIVVYAHFPADLKYRLSEIFQHFQTMNLELKLTKVRLFQHEIMFLGHRISTQEVAMDESKVTEIVKWPALRNIHETCMFLGLCGYY